MKIQECPRIGKHCITMRAVLDSSNCLTVAFPSLINKMPINLPSTEKLVELTPISTVVDLLLNAEKTLTAMHSHPVDMAVVGVETSGLSQLQLVVARKEEKQKRTDEANVAETAEQEIKLAREMSARIKPLASDIKQNTATAEEAMTVLLHENNPAHARKMLLALMQSNTTMIQNLEVLTPSHEESTGGVRVVKGKKPHRIRVDILSIDRAKSSCTARVIKLESESEIFKPTDVGVQVIQLSAFDQDSFFILCQCAALGMTLSVTVSVDISISSKCFQYRASLVSIPDHATVLQQLKDQMISRTMDMFSS